LIIESHKKLIISMLITDIKHHDIILSKLWMNKNEILLNMHHDTIIFNDQLNTSISIYSISSNSKHLSWSWLTSISFAVHSKLVKMFKHSAFIIQKESFSICNIEIILFKTLLNHFKKNKTEIFAMFIKNIDREVVYNT